MVSSLSPPRGQRPVAARRISSGFWVVAATARAGSSLRCRRMGNPPRANRDGARRGQSRVPTTLSPYFVDTPADFVPLFPWRLWTGGQSPGRTFGGDARKFVPRRGKNFRLIRRNAARSLYWLLSTRNRAGAPA